MPSTIYEYLEADHNRLEQLLDRATALPEILDMESFAAFRSGILRHIGIEERIIMPAIAKFQDGKKAETATRLRLDHGAIAALLVPPPTATIIATLRHILQGHNELEEREDGLYNLIDRLAGDDLRDILARAIATPDPPLNPHNTHPIAMESALHALERAGYTLIDPPHGPGL